MRAQLLAADDSPRSLALASMLYARALRGEANHWSGWLGWEPQAPDFAAQPVAGWLRVAGTKAGMDPVANALLAIIAARADDPPVRRDAAHRWANAEPANLASIYYADVAPEALLEAARTRNDFDAHLFDQARWGAEAIARHPTSTQARPAPNPSYRDRTPQSVAEQRAYYEVAPMTKRPFEQDRALLGACRDHPLDKSSLRRSDCIALGRILRDRADLARVQWLGVLILKAVETDPAAIAETERFERRMRWQEQRFHFLFEPTLYEEAQLHRILGDPTIHRDQDAT